MTRLFAYVTHKNDKYGIGFPPVFYLFSMLLLANLCLHTQATDSVLDIVLWGNTN